MAFVTVEIHADDRPAQLGGSPASVHVVPAVDGLPAAQVTGQKSYTADCHSSITFPILNSWEWVTMINCTPNSFARASSMCRIAGRYSRLRNRNGSAATISSLFLGRERNRQASLRAKLATSTAPPPDASKGSISCPSRTNSNSASVLPRLRENLILNE